MSSILRKVRLSIWSIVFVLLFVFCAKNVPVCVYGADNAPKEKVIRVGFFEFPGYHEIDENGVRSGFGYDVLQELLPYTHWKYEYIGYKEGWPQMLDMLADGKIDLISSTIKTPQKLQRFDFSKHPLGMSGTILTFKKGQTKYKRWDYKNWYNLRVGMLNNNSKNDIFHEFSKEKAFSYIPTYYNSVTEMQDALQKGDVDAIVTGSLRGLKNEDIFEEIGIHPFYFAVKKGNQEMLKEVDDAMDRLLADKPDILKELFRKHYDIQRVRAYTPLSLDEAKGQNEKMSLYIHECLRRIAQINNWDVELETGEREELDEEFLNSLDLVCGIIKNEKYLKGLDFPLQSLGSFKVLLAAREDNETFLKNSPEDWPNSFKIGYVPCTLGCTDQLEDFANRYLLKYKYKLIDYPNDSEVLQALKDGKIDLLLTSQQEKQEGIKTAAVCGENDIYFAVPHGKTAVFKELCQTIEYFRIYEQPLIDELHAEYLAPPLSEKELTRATYERRHRERIRVCLYEEKMHGYINDYLSRLAEMYDWDLDYINATYTQAYQYLAERKVDIVPCLYYSKERAENCLYSNLDFEVIYYFLATSPDNEEMLPNQIETWAGARIAVLDGVANAALKQYLNQYDIKCSFQYYDSLAEAEESVREGVNDAVYTMTPQGFKPLAVFPTDLTYLCINKDKPELKEQVDEGMAYLKRHDPNLMIQLMEKHFPSSDYNILMMNKAEMNAVYKFKDRPIRVDISPEVPPLKTYDPHTEMAAGFVKKLLDEVSKDTGLTFEYLPPSTSREARRRILHGESDIWIGFGGDTSPVGKTVVSRNSIYIPLVKVFYKTYENKKIKNDIAAVPVNDFALRSLFDNSAQQENVVFYPSREECYRAVQDGEAGYTIDTLQSAQYTLWKNQRFSELVFQSTLPNEYDDPMQFIYSTRLDETVRNIIDKTLKSFTQDQIQNYLQAVTFTGVKKPLLTPTQQIGLTGALITVILVVILIYSTRSNRAQKRQLAMQKATMGCLESLFQDDQNFEGAVKSIIEMLTKYFNAQMGWFARYDENSITVDAMVGFPKSFRADCLSTVTPETLQAWIDSQKDKDIQQVYYEQTPNLFTVKEWDDYLVQSHVKTIFAAVIRVNGKISGNIAVCFDTIRPELTSQEIYMMKYFQHMVGASQIRRRLIMSLTEERDRAVHAEKAKSFFFACVSHDIRTPLNAIIGFSELLRYGGLDEEQVKNYLESIVFSGNVLMELVNNILDLSKLDAESMVYTYDFCNFRKLGTKVLKAFAHRVSDGNVELRMDFPPQMPALKLDSQHVYQVLFNLMGNAVKFTKQGSITLKANCTPVEGNPAKMDLEFAVRDTGIGIDKKHFASIFKPFQQIQNMTQTGGTGLGLSICTLMIEQMGGTISVDSEVGKGSTFTVKLKNVDWRPLQPEEEETLELKEKTTAAAENASLLLVDDVMMNLNVLEALCKKAGVKDIVKAQSGAEALDILKVRRFTAVLTDMWMPGMSGTELAKLIRMKYNDLPIYLITADVEYLKHYKEEGFTGCLTKPLTLDKLREIF